MHILHLKQMTRVMSKIMRYNNLLTVLYAFLSLITFRVEYALRTLAIVHVLHVALFHFNVTLQCNKGKMIKKIY